MKAASENQNDNPEALAPIELFNQLIPKLLDPLARNLAKDMQWWELNGLEELLSYVQEDCHNNTPTSSQSLTFPVTVSGEGQPLLLLHGFDSSFLEFRRLAPLLKKYYQLIIPDLFGFGFCPRPIKAKYETESLVIHIGKILSQIPSDSTVGVIGASMGGALAMEVARRFPERINRLMLLSPAGLTGSPKPIPQPLNKIGVWFLGQPCVRKRLCRQAFADPNRSVGKQEEQIASLHLSVPNWAESLAEFARSGGLANLGEPIPKQPIKIIWGANDRILTQQQKKEVFQLLGNCVEEVNDCGHLPHLDQPNIVADRWLNDPNHY
ncbi:alpha/beta hydrolase [Prochlorococcus sp. MIT 1300]|uniref:alpha/beta fold hydrolase n=1 Tax=Prochlorococcus sp. MIT 1300 TaxID=3096218 RepID=UPI002A75B090|nr:alpha/beta hydrolase [Prochlorococcus sp. MIT 1300]